MFCGVCGTMLEDDAKFCPNCGTAVEQAADSAPQQAPIQGMNQMQGQSAPEQQQPVNSEPVIDATMSSKCPSCGGALLFDPILGKLKCDFCESVFTPEELEAAWREKEAQALAGSGRKGAAELTADDNMKAYSCSSCGAELMADQNTAVMVCPYCGNHTIAPTQFAGSLRPDYIIPFAHTKQQAEGEYLKYYEKRFLLPKSFKTDNHVEEIQGVYVPFWMFSGRAHIDGRYLAYDESEDDKGNKHITGRFDVTRQGYLDYQNVPADASRRMDDALMDSVEPFKMDGIKDFSLTYLPGFLAERYDVSEEECRERAHNRVSTTTRTAAKNTIRHDGIESSKVDVTYEGERTNYAMFPVWMLTTRWQDKSYKFAMNGQTGRMIGDLPISVPKFLAVIIPLFLGLMVVIGMITLGLDMESSQAIFGSILIPAIITLIVAGVMYHRMKPVGKKSTLSDSMSGGLVLTYQDEKKINSITAGKLKKELRGNQ